MKPQTLETKILAVSREDSKLVVLPDNEVIKGITCAKVVKQNGTNKIVTGDSEGKIAIWADKPWFHPIKDTYVSRFDVYGPREYDSIGHLDAILVNDTIHIVASIDDPHSKCVENFCLIKEEERELKCQHYKPEDSRKQIYGLWACTNDSKLFFVTNDASDNPFVDGGADRSICVRDENARIINTYPSERDQLACVIPNDKLLVLGQKKDANLILDVYKLSFNENPPTFEKQIKIPINRYFNPAKLINATCGKQPIILAQGLRDKFLIKVEPYSAVSCNLETQAIDYYNTRDDVNSCTVGHFNEAEQCLISSDSAESNITISKFKKDFPEVMKFSNKHLSKINELNLMQTSRENINVRILGTGNSVTDPHTTFVIKADQFYLVDHPANVKYLLNEEGLSYDIINNIIITHAHGDHLDGLQDLLLAKHNKKTNLYCTKDVYAQILKKVESLDEGPHFLDLFGNNFKFHELNPFKPYQKGPIKIDARINMHGTSPTIGFKFQYKNSILGYSSDTNYIGERKLHRLSKDLDKNYVKYVREVERAKNSELVRQNLQNIPSYKYMLASYVESIDPGISAMRNSVNESKFSKRINNYKYDVLCKLVDQQSITWFSTCNLLFHEATIYDKKIDRGYKVHTDIRVLMQNLPDDLESKTHIAHLPARFENAFSHLRIKYGTPRPQIAEPGRVYRI